MKNYLCINGKKIVLTDEQVEQLGGITRCKATLSDDGKIATIGDYEFIVLEQDKGQGSVKLLLKDILCNSEFGESVDFKGSKVEEILKVFTEKIASVVGEENIISHVVDLTTDDGLKTYGTAEAKMSLLTCDMYRKYVEILDEFKLDKWWWLATPLSALPHYNTSCVKCVAPSGYIGNYGCYSDYGVRPFCILKSNIFIS